MKNVFAETFPSGTIKASVTSVTLVNNTAKTQDVSVPTDCRWVLQTIKAMNPDNVDRGVTFRIYTEAAKTNLVAVLQSATGSAGGGAVTWPSGTEATTMIRHPTQDLVLAASWTIETIWAAGGASAGATDADGLVITYRELPLT